MNKKTVSVRSMVLTALFTALLCILSPLSIPMPSGMPLTLQTFAIALCGFCLGGRRAAVSVGVFLALGAVGLPVFSGFRGGVGVLVGPTGGFLFGFIAMAFLCGTAFYRKTFWGKIGLSALGLLFCHLAGVVQFALVMQMSFAKSALVASLPFLIKDALSVLLAYALAAALQKSLARFTGAGR